MTCKARCAGDFHQLPPVAKGPAALAGITHARTVAKSGLVQSLERSVTVVQETHLCCYGKALDWHIVGENMPLLHEASV